VGVRKKTSILAFANKIRKNLISMNLKYSALGFVAAIFSLSLTAQVSPQRPGCGTKAPSEQWDAWFNSKVEEYKATKSRPQTAPVTMVIPVIVHVIHGGESIATFPNISGAQIRSQIKVMNDDFAAKGYNIGALAATGFSAVGAANTNISFCLAQFDPDGNALAEPGIDRVNYNTQNWQNPNIPGSANNFQNFMDGTVKPATIWNPIYYFNIWVSDINPTAYLLGYATFPSQSGLSGLTSNLGGPFSDGIWIWSKAFGNLGSLDPTYNRGRTAVHETGHWLGLRHIGGDPNAAAGDCNATDYCADTPPQKGGFGGGSNGQNFGAPSYPLHVNVCGSPYGDMFMNFMDYSDDAVLSMFTPDQNDRIQAAMLNGGFRNQLSASSATQCIGIPTVYFGDVQSGCVQGGSALDFQTDAAAGTSYTWSAEPPAGVVFMPTANSASPSITFPTSGTYTVKVMSSNTIGVSTSTTEVEAQLCTGISKNGSAAKALNIWPNPSSTQFFIELSGSFLVRAIDVRIYNVVGEEMNQVKFEQVSGKQISVNTTELPDGIYFVTVANGDTSRMQRIAVRH
jgi:hypothetical protein